MEMQRDDAGVAIQAFTLRWVNRVGHSPSSIPRSFRSSSWDSAGSRPIFPTLTGGLFRKRSGCAVSSGSGKLAPPARSGSIGSPAVRSFHRRPRRSSRPGLDPDTGRPSTPSLASSNLPRPLPLCPRPLSRPPPGDRDILPTSALHPAHGWPLPGFYIAVTRRFPQVRHGKENWFSRPEQVRGSWIHDR